MGSTVSLCLQHRLTSDASVQYISTWVSDNSNSGVRLLAIFLLLDLFDWSLSWLKYQALGHEFSVIHISLHVTAHVTCIPFCSTGGQRQPLVFCISAEGLCLRKFRLGASHCAILLANCTTCMAYRYILLPLGRTRRVHAQDLDVELSLNSYWRRYWWSQRSRSAWESVFQVRPRERGNFQSTFL